MSVKWIYYGCGLSGCLVAYFRLGWICALSLGSWKSWFASATILFTTSWVASEILDQSRFLWCAIWLWLLLHNLNMLITITMLNHDSYGTKCCLVRKHPLSFSKKLEMKNKWKNSMGSGHALNCDFFLVYNLEKTSQLPRAFKTESCSLGSLANYNCEEARLNTQW